MVNRVLYIFRMVMLLTAISLAGKVMLLCFTMQESTLHCRTFGMSCGTGLPFDLSVAALLALPVWVVTAATMYHPNLRLRAILSPYLVLAFLFVVLVTAGDIVMYHHWKFKLDASIFNYMSSPGSAGASAPMWYIVTCLVLGFYCHCRCYRYCHPDDTQTHYRGRTGPEPD